MIMTMKKLLLAGGAAAMLTATSAYASIIDRPFFKVLGVVVVWGGDDYNENTGAAPVVTDFVLLTPANSGSAGDDLIGADGYAVVTGSLQPISNVGDNTLAGATAVDPVTGLGAGNYTDTNASGLLDVGDVMTSFGIDATTDVGAGMVDTHTSSFYVASNAAFDIFATSSNFVATGDFAGTMTEANISYDMGLTVAGDDGLAYGGNAQNPGTTVPTGSDLSDYLGTAQVFQGAVRTAAARGNLASQSVRFDNTYALDDGTGLGYDLSMGSGTVQADMVFTVYVP
jgi:hypothetical protein